MCLGLCTLSDENLRKVISDPPLVWKVIAPDDEEAYENSRPAHSVSLLEKLFGKNKSESSPIINIADDEVINSDLDKAWHGIHYLLTQTAWEGQPPLNFLVSSGIQIGDIDVGYGPARAFLSDEVKTINAALNPLNEAWLKSRFNPKEMMDLEIYPTIWDREPSDDDTFGYCAEYFSVLKEFIGKAASNEAGVIIYIS
ncbi:MAG: YfbM family protein [Steroidobacteraceae bacterium]